MADNTKDFYQNAYSGQANNSWTGNPDRVAAVAQALDLIDHWQEAKVIDLGCGAGLHTKWLAELCSESRWTGIDMVDAETMKLEVPKNGRFSTTDIRTPEGWQHPYLLEKYDLVVDQGAVFVSLTSDEERDDYLSHVASLLDTDGVFLALIVEGKKGVMHFPDGRVRMRLSRRDIKTMSLDWARKFGLAVLKMNAKVYEPNTPHNPLSERIRVMHITMIKI